MKQDSKKASPQLISTSIHIGVLLASPGLRRKPYQAKVITTLLINHRQIDKASLYMGGSKIDLCCPLVKIL